MKFTVLNDQFSINDQFTVFNTFATRTQTMKTVNCELKTATTKGVA